MTSALQVKITKEEFMIATLAQTGRQLKTPLFKATNLSPFKVTDFVDFPAPTTPGNVGICLSGGGSRAMVAGMGQLQALKKLSNEQGSLLGQTKALSTVSGGSWVGVPFTYLTPSCTDDQFLGLYFPPSTYSVDSLQQISQYQIGARCIADFSPVALAIQLVGLLIAGLPDYMAWQTLVGIHILKFYGLYAPNKEGVSTPFSYDVNTVSQIIAENPSLKDTPFNLVATDDSRVRRPYLVCNTALFAQTAPLPYESLTPLQITPFFAGVISNPPNALDVQGEAIGGGAITSFSFNSNLDFLNKTTATVSSTHLFSLMDAAGVSSSFFAESLQNLGKKWHNNLDHFFEDAQGKLGTHWSLLHPHVPEKYRDKFTNLLTKIRSLELSHQNTNAEKPALEAISPAEFNTSFAKLAEIVPKYKYWSIKGKGGSQTPLNPFADGGNLENTGISALLTYQDIENIIAFVNSSTPLEISTLGILDKQGKQVPGTNIKVDSQLPPLFGYQPYDDQAGYKMYKGDAHPKDPQFCNNQLFPSEAFQKLLLGLWSASGNQTKVGSNQHGAIYRQDLTTIENQWLGVRGGNKITVLWVYNNFVQDWYEQLDETVRHEIFKDDPKSFFNFPNYATTDTQLTTTQVNLLASLSAWNILEGDPEQFLNMFRK